MITLKRRVTRETGVIDLRTRQPIVVRLEEGGKLLRMKPKRSRTWYTVPLEVVCRIQDAEAKACLQAVRDSGIKNGADGRPCAFTTIEAAIAALRRRTSGD